MHKALPFEQAVQEHGPGIRRAYTYKALNKLIQGSAADMTKKAMLELHKEGIIPHIQVHDELDISVKDEQHAELIKNVMEDAVSLEVPNKVDYESGPKWGTIKEKQEKTMDHLKTVMTWAKANKQKSVIIVIVVIAIIALIK